MSANVPVGAAELRALTGISYRQLDWWCTKGYLKPEQESTGPGSRRTFGADEVAVACRMVQMVESGVTPKLAAVAARATSVRLADDVYTYHESEHRKLAEALGLNPEDETLSLRDLHEVACARLTAYKPGARPSKDGFVPQLVDEASLDALMAIASTVVNQDFWPGPNPCDPVANKSRYGPDGVRLVDDANGLDLTLYSVARTAIADLVHTVRYYKVSVLSGLTEGAE